MKFAFNNNGILQDVVMTHPSILFPESYAVQFIEVPDNAQNGYEWDGVNATEPKPPELSEEQIQQLIDSKVDALWNAADKYIERYISGVAIGILTLGVSKMKPKALNVTEWTQAIWASYYHRKAQVTATSVDDHDFTMFGPIPHSIMELKEEAGI